jgi:hypothetical protein
MTTEQLHTLHTARPFIPFDMVMADGTRYHVPHPEYLAYVPKTRTCTVYDEHGVARILDLLLMTALEVVKPRRRKAG